MNKMYNKYLLFTLLFEYMLLDILKAYKTDVGFLD